MLHPRGKGLAIFVVVLGFWCLATEARSRPARRQTSNTPVLSSNTRLVAVPVSVTNHRGDFVPNLTAQNFTIWQDGQRQTIAFFEQQNSPATVGLLIDGSGSMATKLPYVAAASYDLAHSSNPRDQMFVVDFADEVMMPPLAGGIFTSDPHVLQRAVAAVSAAGETALYDAITAGLQRLDRGRWNKKALIIVSDGGDNASHHTFSQVLRMARGSHAVIYAIGLVGASGEEENPGVLRRLCEETGGLVFFPKQVDAIAADSKTIASDIRDQYMLGYVPPENSAPGTYHKIKVKVVAPGRGKLHVRARPGFYTASQSSTHSGTAFPK